jgi:hypothetical protein
MTETLTPGAKRAGPGEYVFDLRDVNRIMGGPGYSPVFGGCVEGERMIVALMRYPAGKPRMRTRIRTSSGSSSSRACSR